MMIWPENDQGKIFIRFSQVSTLDDVHFKQILPYMDWNKAT